MYLTDLERFTIGWFIQLVYRARVPMWLPSRNASAISGEYLSAASFLGVAGLVYSRGIDMLWFPIGYTMGYLVLLVLIAAPLRRSGAYTLALGTPNRSSRLLSRTRFSQSGICSIEATIASSSASVRRVDERWIAPFLVRGRP